MNCQGCRFWERGAYPASRGAESAATFGYCHRFPPQLAGAAARAIEQRAFFPTTNDRDWCGEYVARPPDV